jgi:ELWxxDGT repeat protein
MKTTAGALALCLTAAAAQAQPAYRVKDVNPLAAHGSRPTGFTTIAGVTYFVADDLAHGREMWRTDGTPEGTRLVKDAAPGPNGFDVGLPVAFAGAAYFVADRALWRTNGELGGTARIRSLGVSSSSLAVQAGWLFFADRDDHGIELWRTDGTDAGTERVADIAPGADSSSPYAFVAAGGLLYFSARGPGGQELWRTDGSAAGTLQVHDIRPGASGSNPLSFTVAGAQLFFSADDGVHGRELWSTGFDSGVTALVRDIAPGADGSSPVALAAMSGSLFFSATDGTVGAELWTSDGTAGGTRLVRDIAPGAAHAGPWWLTAVGSTLYFTIEGVNGAELWRSDGTATGTQRVAGTTGLFQPDYLAAHDGALFFSADTPAHGRELWRSDGTLAGTTVRDLRPGPQGSRPQSLMSTGGRLYFAATPPDVAVSVGGEPWASDGTVAGSVLLRRIDSAASSDVAQGGDVGGVFVFGADDGVHGDELWRSDGTEAGTWLVADLLPGPDGSSPGSFTSYAGALYFTAFGSGTAGLWRTDGTAAGTVRVTGPEVVSAGAVERAGPYLFFDATDAIHGSELWRSDGTTAGTVLVRDLAPGPSTQAPELLTDVNGTLFFRGYDPTEGYALWKSDGTEAGTVRVEVVRPGPGSADIRYLAAAGGLLFFVADDGLHGMEPWVSNGTDAGTFQVRDVRPGPASSLPRFVTGAGGLAFFSASDGPTGYEPWRSDGTEAGTFRLADIFPGATGSAPSPMTPVGDTVLFAADDGVGGHELWRSDGTEAGTARVREIAPGVERSLGEYQPLGAWGGWAFFAASDGEHGQELWRSDGTTAGTTLVQDLRPGPMASAPAIVAAAGGRLFLTAVDATGREPWLLRPELAVANATAPEGTHALVDVSLVPRLDVPLAVPFTTVDNSAVGASDFQAKRGVLRFAPGETLQTVDVTVLDDVAPETIEQFFVDVAPGGNAFAARPRGVVTVTDDDPLPVLTVDDAAVIEGNAGSVGLAFTVRLSAASATAVTVGYATAEGTASGGADFQATSGTLTFAPGVTARTVAVNVWGDVADEPDEFFPLRLSLPSGAVAGTGQGVGRIRDDDGAAIRLSALDAGMDVTADLAALPGPAADEDLYLVELSPFESYEVTVDAASGDLGDFGPIVEVLARDMTVVDWALPSGVGHALSARMMGSSSASMPTVQRYIRVRSAGCLTDCGADDTYRIRLRETTGRVARFNQAGGQRTFMILHNTTGELVETEVHYRRADGTFAGANLISMSPRGTTVLPAPETTQGTSGSILVMHRGPLGALAGKAVALEEATGLAFDTPMETHPR